MEQPNGKCCPICKIVKALVIIGALNWGLVGLFRVDAVEALCGTMTAVSRAVYSLIGVCGLAMAASFLKSLCPCRKNDDSASCKK
ncbi:MAG: DUF378 domain-containing protein [Candidatus Omnitrophota bacterium]